MGNTEFCAIDEKGELYSEDGEVVFTVSRINTGLLEELVKNGKYCVLLQSLLE